MANAATSDRKWADGKVSDTAFDHKAPSMEDRQVGRVGRHTKGKPGRVTPGDSRRQGQVDISVDLE